jgi:hypothetical protein
MYRINTMKESTIPARPHAAVAVGTIEQWRYRVVQCNSTEAGWGPGSGRLHFGFAPGAGAGMMDGDPCPEDWNRP